MPTTTRTLTALIFRQYIEPAVSSVTATSVALFPSLMPRCAQLILRSHAVQGAGDVACWPPSPGQEPAPRHPQCNSCRGCLFSACTQGSAGTAGFVQSTKERDTSEEKHQGGLSLHHPCLPTLTPPCPAQSRHFNTPPSPLEREALLKIQLQTCQLSTPVCLFHDISSPYSTSGAGKHSPTQWVLRLAVSRGGTPYQPQEDYSLSTQQHEGKSYRRPVSHCEISSISAPHLKPHREFWTTAYPSKG